MARKKPKKSQQTEPEAPPAVNPPTTVKIPPAGEAQVEYAPIPPRAPEGKTIHPRRPLPAVPDKRSDEGNGPKGS